MRKLYYLEGNINYKLEKIFYNTNYYIFLLSKDLNKPKCHSKNLILLLIITK